MIVCHDPCHLKIFLSIYLKSSWLYHKHINSFSILCRHRELIISFFIPAVFYVLADHNNAIFFFVFPETFLVIYTCPSFLKSFCFSFVSFFFLVSEGKAWEIILQIHQSLTSCKVIHGETDTPGTGVNSSVACVRVHTGADIHTAAHGGHNAGAGLSWSWWRGPMLEQGRSVRSREQERGTVMGGQQSPIPHFPCVTWWERMSRGQEWGSEAAYRGKKVAGRKVVSVLSLFLIFRFNF